jgi:hypothetical protein
MARKRMVMEEYCLDKANPQAQEDKERIPHFPGSIVSTNLGCQLQPSTRLPLPTSTLSSLLTPLATQKGFVKVWL